jgi:6-pyruvoyltetrahydropterin/6-carboxytetrahydropterin synthase
MSISCTRRLTFCAGHRVMGHESKCANLHGHNYVVEIEATLADDESRGLDKIGRVVDFSILKERIGGWIELWWDHGFILSMSDEAALKAMIEFGDSNPRGQKLYVMAENPTAENIALFLLESVCPVELSGTGVVVERVVVHETENCLAEAWI